MRVLLMLMVWTIYGKSGYIMVVYTFADINENLGTRQLGRVEIFLNSCMSKICQNTCVLALY